MFYERKDILNQKCRDIQSQKEEKVFSFFENALLLFFSFFTDSEPLFYLFWRIPKALSSLKICEFRG